MYYKEKDSVFSLVELFKKTRNYSQSNDELIREKVNTFKNKYFRLKNSENRILSSNLPKLKFDSEGRWWSFQSFIDFFSNLDEESQKFIKKECKIEFIDICFKEAIEFNSVFEDNEENHE